MGSSKKAPDPPAAPDYTAAADKQATSSREITDANTWANRPNQVTPWGTQTWNAASTIDPATGKPYNSWTQTTQLSPQSQAALDAQLALTQNRSDLGNSMFGRVGSELSKPVDWNSFSKAGGIPGVTDVGDPNTFRQHGEDAAYRRMTSRLDPQWQQKEQATDIKLRNQGLKPGDEAYDTAMHNLSMDRTDAYQTAMDQSSSEGRAESAQAFGQGVSRGDQTFGQGMQASNLQTQQRQQQIAESLQQRGWSLNEINALLSGQQVSNPNMPSFNPAARSETPQYLNAAQAQYGSTLDAYNAKNGGNTGNLAGLAGLANAGANWWSVL